jgi:V-type H+-transporting ATPase subunit a
MRLSEHDAKVQQMNTSQETLNKRYLELTELRHVLRETAAFFEEAEHRNDTTATHHGYGRLDNGTGVSPLLADALGEAETGDGDGFLRTANLG